MTAPPHSKLQSMLQAAVQSVQWTYSIFWQLCPQQGILRWGDGYYNGAIKTRKTVEETEMSSEEACLQRSQQLRELHELLSDGETQRSYAALLPEDLTESEWFYLLCVSFTFHPSVGLPGTAYARRRYVWLTGANEVDCKTFSRAILAKSARIQTLVCIPLLEGVVEFATTEKVQEDLNFIQHVKSFFIDDHPPMPHPSLSGHSTFNPTPSYPAIIIPNHDEKEEEAELDPHAQTICNNFTLSELLEPDTVEDFLAGSPHGGSNHMWEPVEEPIVQEGSAELAMLQHQKSASVFVPSEDLAESDAHHSQTVSTILQNDSRWWRDPTSVGHLTGSIQSAFTKWTTDVDNHHLHTVEDDVTSQWLLKCILFSIPCFHAANNSLHMKEMPRNNLSSSHVMAERRRREKLNERFIILRSLVPFVTKTDKASILGDTIEYVKQLKQKMQNLEARNRQMEMDQRWIITKKKRVREVEVEVSIIESDALLEVECMHREGLLLDVMKILRELRLEVIMVQSSVNHGGVFVAKLRAKVRGNANGKKASIVEVKKALNLILPHHYHHPYSVAANGSMVCMDSGCMQDFYDFTETTEGDNAHNAMSVNS